MSNQDSFNQVLSQGKVRVHFIAWVETPPDL